jgi:beta-xylosidase
MLPNPLIPGFSPDPSIVLVDGVYYLVTSSGNSPATTARKC